MGLIGFTLANQNVPLNPALLKQIEVVEPENKLFLHKLDFPKIEIEPYSSPNTSQIGCFVLSSSAEKLYTWQAAVFLMVEGQIQWYQISVDVEDAETFWNKPNRHELVKFEVCEKPIVAWLKRP